MNVTGIGIQTIRPTTATTVQSMPQQQANEHDADAAPIFSKQAPQPPKGLGKFVNKYA
jgi:hypothetical protein